MKKRIASVFLIASTFLFIVVLNPIASANQGATPPSKYGEVAFSFNENSPKQIFIIALSHKNTLTYANGSGTIKAQIEAYRIGEWLIQRQGVELVLPEGFFEKEPVGRKDNSAKNVPCGVLDDKSLAEKLGSQVRYFNAEMLLEESFGVKSRQIEDRQQYMEVREKIKMLEEYGDDSNEAPYIKDTLNYLMERRTAAMLQNIPDIIEAMYVSGGIKKKKAILTIGLNHVAEIIKYLKQHKIKITAPVFSSKPDYVSNIELLDRDFGVTIIIPRTLADDTSLLRLTKLLK